MKLVQVRKENERYYTKEFVHGFNTGAKTQYEADMKDAVKHGRWEIDGHHRRCSECLVYFCIQDREGDLIPNKFCPNCGAKMDEVKE